MRVQLSPRWTLTTHHPAVSYGQPVLVDEANNPAGPGDWLLDEDGGVVLAADLVARLAREADLDAEGRAMVARYCLLELGHESNR